MEYLIVADTNLFLECKRLEDIPWLELEVDSVVVLLTKPVLGEIDRHKRSSGRTRKRALAISGRIRGMLKSGVAEETVREGSPRVTLRLAPVVRPDPDMDEVLDYSINDDRIVGIASALGKENATKQVVFLTDDSVAASTAHSVGVPFRLIDEGWKRPPTRTAEAKRIEELERELDAFRAQEPRIALEDATASWVEPRIAQRVPLPLGTEEVDTLIERLHERHPMQTEFPVPEPQERNDGARVTFLPPDPEAVERYRAKDYPNWVEKCRATLQKLHESVVEVKSGPVLTWALENQGGRPAVQVRVAFAAEGGLRFRRLSTSLGEDEGETDARQEKASGTPPRLEPPPRPPQVQRSVDRSGVVVNPSGAQARMEPSGPLMRDIRQIVGAGTALSELARLREAVVGNEPTWRGHLRGLAQPVASTMDIPDLTPFVPPKHDKEAFYYDDWPADEPVRQGALTCDLYRHRSAKREFEVEVVFPQDGNVRGTVVCTVHAENLTEPVSLRIAVSRHIERYSLLEEARALIDSCGDRH